MAEERGPRAAATDPYEASVTEGAGPVRHRDKHVARLAAALMVPLALLMLVASAAVATGADPAAPPAAALIPFGVFLWTAWVILTRTVVRTAVTSDAVIVQWGLREHRVPLGAITACEAKARAGGPTVATGAGWALFADRGSVALSWRDGGVTKSLLVPAADPPTLAAEIEAARAARGTGVRVAADGAAPAEAEAEGRAAGGGARAGRG